MREFYVLVVATLASNTLLLAFLAWAYRSERFRSRRIELGAPMKVSNAARLKNMATSAVLSLAVVIGCTYFLFEALFTSTPTAWWVIALQAAGILVVYDWTYYALHRGMHHKKLMRWVHGVHHRARNPSALESFYLHPLELLAGLGLLVASTWVSSLWAPVHVYAFAAAFFVYSTLNIVIHSGLDFGHPLLWPIDALTRKHHVHHRNDFSKNYASLTPLPDMFFGTAG